MKNYPLIALILLFSNCGAHHHRYDVSYTDYKYILLLTKADNKEDTLHFVADQPDLSPDGSRVAYTRLKDNEVRQIEIRDADNGSTMTIDTACTNCCGPVWSPDGKHLAYNAFIDDHWCIQLWDFDAGTPTNLSKSLNPTGEAYSPTWSDDGRKVVVQDMKNVYILDLTGKPIDHIPIAQLKKDPSISSGSTYCLSKDETKIIFDMEIDDTSSDDNPPLAIYVYDRQAKTTSPISPKGYSCFQPSIYGDRIFFTGRKEEAPLKSRNDPVFNIYSMNLNGGDFRVEYKGRRDYSQRRLNTNNTLPAK